MSEVKHTPGPWGADIEDVSDTFLHRAVIGANGELVADCDNNDLSAEETAANANLIAAAPDLLAMLKVAQLWLDVDGHFDMRGINAAIAKAEGRTP